MKIKPFFAIFLFLAIFWGFSRLAFAELKNKEPDAVKLSKIKIECKNIKKQISKIRSSDALKRVNLGQSFETISNDLMQKLNTRFVLNKLDGGELLTISANFNEKFVKFKDDYHNYERELTHLYDIDCVASPNEFYQVLEKVRVMRNELNTDVKEINEISKKYQETVSKIKESGKI